MLRCIMNKPVVSFEPFTDNIGGDFLVPASHHDLHRLEEAGVTSLMEMVKRHSFTWQVRDQERFLGIRLNVANLVMLEKLFAIQIKHQTIDQ